MSEIILYLLWLAFKFGTFVVANTAREIVIVVRQRVVISFQIRYFRSS